eukprot:CAMPEP_0198697200 /NCGR_PEP_ID=MMETSP1468-20131203/319161_1 /TAXON_ID=1461545 /ORGANISM="Mantoniella sp, Strain CCMP1436" /LENGTH=91 /DNA_ID=CAMNT_0044453791 /DNA_START=86 /DNA_END=357 /DNA_ORIENTATION=-
MLGDLSNCDQTAAVGWGRSADRVRTEVLGGEWLEHPEPSAADPWGFLCQTPADQTGAREKERREREAGTWKRDASSSLVATGGLRYERSGP